MVLADQRPQVERRGVLGEVVDLPTVLGEFSYNIALYGEPDVRAPWGWQLFGHHAALNCLVVEGRMALSPVFLGAEPDEIDAIKLETKKTFELVQFVGQNEISPLYYDQPYYIVPTDELAEDAYRVVRDALRKSGKVGLGQLTVHGSEKLCAVRPCGDGLLMETLFYADEIKDAEPLFNTIEDDETDSDLLTVATALIDKKTAPFDASAFHDNFDRALRQLIEDKRKGRAPRVTAGSDKPSSDNVVDLMQALRESLKASGGTAPEKESKAPSRAKSKAEDAPAKAPAKRPARKAS